MLDAPQYMSHRHFESMFLYKRSQRLQRLRPRHVKP